MSDWAGVLEVWTWTYYIAEANTQMGLKMRKNMHFKIKKWRKNSEDGLPSQTRANREGHTPPVPHANIL